MDAGSSNGSGTTPCSRAARAAMRPDLRETLGDRADDEATEALRDDRVDDDGETSEFCRDFFVGMMTWDLARFQSSSSAVAIAGYMAPTPKEETPTPKKEKGQVYCSLRRRKTMGGNANPGQKTSP